MDMIENDAENDHGVFRLFCGTGYDRISRHTWRESFRFHMSQPRNIKLGGVNMKDSSRGYTFLHHIIIYNKQLQFNVEMASFLLGEMGADPNVRDRYGCTPLVYAVRLNMPGMVQLLIKKGADPNTRTNGLPNGTTVLHDAVRFGFYGLIPLLKGASAKLTDQYGYTASQLIFVYWTQRFERLVGVGLKPIDTYNKMISEMSLVNPRQGVSHFASAALAWVGITDFPYSSLFPRSDELLCFEVDNAFDFENMIELYNTVYCDPNEPCQLQPFDPNTVIDVVDSVFKESSYCFGFWHGSGYHEDFWNTYYYHKDYQDYPITLLHLAFRRKFYDIAEVLLKRGAKFTLSTFVDLKSGSTKTTKRNILINEALLGNFRALELLFKYGADPNYKVVINDPRGLVTLSLIYLILFGRTEHYALCAECILTCMKYGLDIFADQGPDFHSRFKVSTVFELIKRDYISNANIFAMLALHRESADFFRQNFITKIRNGSYNFVSEVVAALANETEFDINSTAGNPGNLTLLALAIQGANPVNTANAILENSTRVNINTLDENGQSYLHHAIMLRDAMPMIELLVRYGANINIQDDPGLKTILHWAVLQKKYELGAQLIKLGADPKIKDIYGEDIMGCIRSTVPTPKQQDYIFSILLSPIAICSTN